MTRVNNLTLLRDLREEVKVLIGEDPINFISRPGDGNIKVQFIDGVTTTPGYVNAVIHLLAMRSKLESDGEK